MLQKRNSNENELAETAGMRPSWRSYIDNKWITLLALQLCKECADAIVQNSPASFLRNEPFPFGFIPPWLFVGLFRRTKFVWSEKKYEISLWHLAHRRAGNETRTTSIPTFCRFRLPRQNGTRAHVKFTAKSNSWTMAFASQNYHFRS